MSPRPSRATERRPQILAAAARVTSERGLDQIRLSADPAQSAIMIGSRKDVA